MPTVQLHGSAVPYRVRRSKRAKKVRITADLDGITVVIPHRRSVDAADVLKRNADWVRRHYARLQARRREIPDRTFADGASWPLLAQPHRLTIADRSEVADGEIRLDADRVAQTSIREELEKVYRDAARTHYTDRADHFCDVMGVTYGQIHIRNQKTRWGSYSSRTGTLSLNVRLLMAPGEIVDYVIVHELAHTVHPNHSRAFWSLVARHDAEYRRKDNWLNEHGHRLVFDAPAS